MIKTSDNKLLGSEQGTRIKYLRKITHLTRRAFALKHKLSPGTLQNCEDGRYHGLTQKTALKLITAFKAEGIDCELEWLLFGEGIEPIHSFKTTSPSQTQTHLNEVDILQETLENEKRHQLNNKLFEAAFDGRFHEVVKLIENGVDAFLYEGIKIKPYEIDLNTPLHLASLNGHLEIIKYLIKKGVDVNAKNRKSQTPLHLAIHNAHKNIIDFLLHHNANINALDSEGDTPLAWAAYKGQLEIVKQLIALKTNINIANKTGNSPLHWASGEGYTDIVKLLIEHDANLTCLNEEDHTPLKVAIHRGQTETVKFLLNIQKRKAEHQ
jgi:ankyrin repeat protein